MSDDRLFFRSESDEKWNEFLMPKVSKKAHYCPTCDALFIGPAHTEVWTCAACTEKVPEDFEVCWKCGQPRGAA